MDSFVFPLLSINLGPRSSSLGRRSSIAERNTQVYDDYVPPDTLPSPIFFLVPFSHLSRFLNRFFRRTYVHLCLPI